MEDAQYSNVMGGSIHEGSSFITHNYWRQYVSDQTFYSSLTLPRGSRQPYTAVHFETETSCKVNSLDTRQITTS